MKKAALLCLLLAGCAANGSWFHYEPGYVPINPPGLETRAAPQIDVQSGYGQHFCQK